MDIIGRIFQLITFGSKRVTKSEYHYINLLTIRYEQSIFQGFFPNVNVWDNLIKCFLLHSFITSVPYNAKGQMKKIAEH